MLSSILGRVRLYSTLLCRMSFWAVRRCVGWLLRQPHPLGWPADQDFNTMVLRTLFRNGNYHHWRNFMRLWFFLNGKKDRKGLQLQEVPPDAFGVPGCRSSWWISLDPSRLVDAPPRKASCVLMFVHGGGFMAGDPLMYCPAFRYWMQQLAAQGISMRVLAVGYPLAPEHPYPAAPLAVTAAYHWLVAQLEAEGCSDSIILGGDSAGGNLVLAALAHMKDSSLLQQQGGSQAAEAASVSAGRAAGRVRPPAAAVLISPAVDFTPASTFQPFISAYLAGLHARQHGQRVQMGTTAAAPASRPLPVMNEWDCVDLSEGASVAQHYVQAQREEDMSQPLVSPVLLPDFRGLVQHDMLLLWGAIERIAPDIAAFAEVVQASGARLQAHAEPNEAHVYCVLPFKEVLRKGAEVLVPFLASAVLKDLQN